MRAKNGILKHLLAFMGGGPKGVKRAGEDESQSVSKAVATAVSTARAMTVAERVSSEAGSQKAKQTEVGDCACMKRLRTNACSPPEVSELDRQDIVEDVNLRILALYRGSLIKAESALPAEFEKSFWNRMRSNQNFLRATAGVLDPNGVTVESESKSDSDPESD